MALRSKRERKPVCHDTVLVLVDVGECYSSTSSTTVAANRIDKFLWVSCKDAKECKRLKVKKDLETPMMRCVCHSALDLREKYKHHIPSLGSLSVFA